MITDTDTSCKLSIVIPLYNVEEYLEECLDSVRESIEDIDAEVLMIENGSTDHTAEIAQNYEKTHRDFKYYSIDHAGVSDARNYGVLQARGEYLTFVDADDIVKKDIYKKMLSAAEELSADMVIVNAERFNSNGTWSSNLHNMVFKEIYSKTTDIRSNRHLVYDATVWNKLIKRTLWDDSGISFPTGLIYEDIPVCIQLHCRAKKVAAVRDIEYLWRWRDGDNKSISQRTETDFNLDNKLRAADMTLKWIRDEAEDNYNVLAGMTHKILSSDIMIFIRKFSMLDSDTIDKFRTKICDFLDSHFVESDYYDLDKKDQQIYNLLRQNDIEGIKRML